MKMLVLLVFLLSGVLASDDCSKYFANISTALSKLYECIATYGQPLAVCGQCGYDVSQFTRLLNDSTTKNQFGVPCKQFIEDETLIQPWKSLVQPVLGFWGGAFCGQCLINGTTEYNQLSVDDFWPKYNLSAYNEITLSFFKQLNETLNCISNYILNTNASVLDPVNFPPSSLEFNITVCHDCHHQYVDLIENFKSWVQKVDGHRRSNGYEHWTTTSLHYRGLCIDVVDAVNRTQFVWSKLLSCSQPPQNRTIVYFLPLIFCAIVGVLFHGAVLCVFHQPSRVVVYMQSRVEQSTEPVNQTSENSFNPSSSFSRKTSFAPMPRNISFDAVSTWKKKTLPMI